LFLEPTSTDQLEEQFLLHNNESLWWFELTLAYTDYVSNA